MKHRLKADAPAVDFFCDEDTPVTVPWVLDWHGAPQEITLRAGSGAYLDLTGQYLHWRDEERGSSRTITPTAAVLINWDEPWFELEFRDPDNPRRFMPSVTIRDGIIEFSADDGAEGFFFDNTAMFEAFCDFMASPAFNPFATPIPPVTEGLCADVQGRTLSYRAYVPDDDDDDEADPYLGRETDYPIDETYCPVIGFIVEFDRPITVWDKEIRGDREIAPGRYQGRVTSWRREDGVPLRLRISGTGNDGYYLYDGFVAWETVEKELRLEHARWQITRERQPFDPTHYRPAPYGGPVIAKQSAIMMPPAGTMSVDGVFGVMRKLLGRS